MIITLTGKPCTGKSTTAEIFVKKYGFKRVYAGAVFKSIAREMGVDISDFASTDKIIEIDFKVDNDLKKIYNLQKDENILIESRTAYSFMPDAFNVFIDITDEEMAKRLFNSDRPEIERGRTIEEAKTKVLTRYNKDVERYKRIYNINVDDLSNYDCVIDNTCLSPEETADKIYENYIKFITK